MKETVLAILVIVVCASPFLWFLGAVIFAPDGYEDEQGFHYGERKDDNGDGSLHDRKRDIYPFRR